MLTFTRAKEGRVRSVGVMLIIAATMPATLAQSNMGNLQGTKTELHPSETKTGPDSKALSEYYRLRQDGNSALYNLDYQKARECFEKMSQIAPDEPASYVYLANDLWLETLNRSRRLSTSLYSTTSFYVQNAESDETDRARDRQFEAWITKGIEAAAAKLAKYPSDAEALYYQASALGLRAGYKATVGRSFRRAIGDANKSIQLQHKVLALDPCYVDAYLSVGMYEYVIDSLPFLWRTLARLAGLKGSKERGIKELETVVKSGKYASDDARVLLIAIYSREHQPEKALEELNYLAARYPANYLFSVERARMLFDAGRTKDGADVLAALLQNPSIARA
ncbi:MAG: tetratricopeptide repeat protein, partial [Blastocatellia bacterium]